MTYRLATSADTDQIAALHVRSWQETYRGIMPDSFLDHEVQAERLACWQDHFRDNNPDRHLILAETGGEIVGFACTLVNSDPVFGALLDNLHVAAAMKGHGIGRHLIRQSVEWVQQRCPDSAYYLWVYEKNHAARQFYDRLGAVDEGPLQGEYAVMLRYVWYDMQALLAACHPAMR